MSTDIETPFEHCGKCRNYVNPSERERHVCTPPADDFDEHPADDMGQYQDYPYDYDY